MAAILTSPKASSAPDTITTRNPGNSLGNSNKVLCDTDILKVSWRKLLNTEESMLWLTPKKALAIRNNTKSLFFNLNPHNQNTITAASIRFASNSLH
jgi:hypothetical protein